MASLLGFRVLSGSGTYTPTVGTTRILVFAVGGGGGGGGVEAGGMAGGAGSGSWAYKFIGPTLAANYSFACGAAGAGGAAGLNDGTDGGETTFGTGPILTCPGGLGSLAGQAANNLNNGANGGAVATGGDINTKGEGGQFGVSFETNGIAGSGAQAGRGGSNPFGIGGRSRNNSNGDPASGMGAGGGGGGGLSGDQSGGAGAAGGIVIWEFS